MEMVVLEQKDASDWIYRGEGAANIVLAYSGSSPSFIGTVLRIQKASRKESEHGKISRALTVHEGLVWKDTEDLVSAPNKELAGQLYVERVISPLLGSKYVDAGVRIPVVREFLESIENNVIFKRPAWRVDAAKVDTRVDSVLLLSDHSLFPNGTHEGEPSICVEIKPKCGFLPISEFIGEGNAVKLSVPRYRMHQALKLHEGEISAYSEYDPLDLFSGSKERIHKAIKDLFSSPQNNFRVFLDGSLIFGTLGAAADSTNLVIQEAFEDALKGIIQGDHGLRTNSFLQLVSETIYLSRVTDRLLQVQKLDNIDIEGAIHAYYNIISEPCKVCRELGKEKLSQKYVSLHSISLDESLKIVKDFLIAATAKDCSLMMSFRLRKEEILGCSYNNVYLESTNQSFDYKVCFIDLDLKPLSKMEEYYEKDQKIVRCYTQMVEAKREVDKVTSLKKTVVSVELLCSRCRQKVMKLIARIEGITSIVLDPAKNIVTVIGEADPVRIIRKVRKFRKTATIVTVGPPKEEKKDEKKDVVSYPSSTCKKCDVWYVVAEDAYSHYCTIM